MSEVVEEQLRLLVSKHGEELYYNYRQLEELFKEVLDDG